MKLYMVNFERNILWAGANNNCRLLLALPISWPQCRRRGWRPENGVDIIWVGLWQEKEHLRWWYFKSKILNGFYYVHCCVSLNRLHCCIHVYLCTSLCLSWYMRLSMCMYVRCEFNYSGVFIHSEEIHSYLNCIMKYYLKCLLYNYRTLLLISPQILYDGMNVIAPLESLSNSCYVNEIRLYKVS